MYAEDNPDEFRLVKTGEPEPVSDAERNAAWERVLIGRQRELFMGRFMPSPAVLARAREIMNAGLRLQRAVSGAGKTPPGVMKSDA